MPTVLPTDELKLHFIGPRGQSHPHALQQCINLVMCRCRPWTSTSPTENVDLGTVLGRHGH